MLAYTARIDKQTGTVQISSGPSLSENAVTFSFPEDMTPADLSTLIQGYMATMGVRFYTARFDQGRVVVDPGNYATPYSVMIAVGDNLRGNQLLRLLREVARRAALDKDLARKL